MSLLQVENLSKSFGVLELFSHLSFVIEKGQKIGLIAPNGAGKTTLLRMLVGEESVDSGEIITMKDLRIAYLPQKSDFSAYPDILSASLSGIAPNLQEVILEYEAAVESGVADRLSQAISAMDQHDGWHIEQELRALLSQLELGNPHRSTQGLSGGQTKRIALASVLLRSPDLFILDEPTNHLDPKTVEWLENYLSTSSAGLLMVTHDRYFLDQVCDTIMELDDKQIYIYEGNYSLYLQKRTERLEQMESEQATLRNRYRTELEWMRRMPKARSTKARYRKDAFEDLQGRLRSIPTQQGPRLESASVYIGKKIFEARGLSKSYDNLEIIKNFSYSFARRDRVGIIGPNGAGKTTLIRLIMQEIEPTSGTIEVGETVRFGYFSQLPPTFPEEKKVIEVVTDIAEHVVGRSGAEHSAMQLLNRFLFPPKRQQDYVSLLSGGERRRLQLCTVLMQKPNFLVLDEPTNDLDIPTLQVLEEYLSQFDGCLLVVSHDRYFMDRITEHLFVLEGEGKVRDFPGNYTDYRNTPKEDRASKQKGEKLEPVKQRPERDKKKLSYKEQRELEQLTALLPELEKKLWSIEDKMNSGVASPQELVELGALYAETKDELDLSELRWLELSEIAE
ncbi:MAG: ABC-F family ATP-binding cassette domain-containing protein [Bacteroidales bacterium]|uniref:ribosomal protection-like ABC-F family protein n=1 Tax=Porphyromonas sp. TaxID=1924944 RepID=UPI00297109EE|nr:ABC-F family ATP-binding cassette domain-containing protein [Porphyromonas sp.]MDD7438780.1 ABC-F family ATP-binding cassette domain-containing protein [Bacteroidales bacterium]MDY3066780.1 ABC-F family ATP-binding cassette domain-containing protein [Porphyromonas sp.]